jgi:hypothetical protein
VVKLALRDGRAGYLSVLKFFQIRLHCPSCHLIVIIDIIGYGACSTRENEKPKNPEEKMSFWRPKRRWENDTRMHHIELGNEDVDLINLTQVRVNCLRLRTW